MNEADPVWPRDALPAPFVAFYRPNSREFRFEPSLYEALKQHPDWRGSDKQQVELWDYLKNSDGIIEVIFTNGIRTLQRVVGYPVGTVIDSRSTTP